MGGVLWDKHAESLCRCSIKSTSLPRYLTEEGKIIGRGSFHCQHMLVQSRLPASMHINRIMLIRVP